MIFLGISKNFNFSEMSYYTTNKKFLQAGALHHAAESLSLLKKCGFLNFSVISQVFFDLTDKCGKDYFCNEGILYQPAKGLAGAIIRKSFLDTVKQCSSTVCYTALCRTAITPSFISNDTFSPCRLVRENTVLNGKMDSYSFHTKRKPID